MKGKGRVEQTQGQSDDMEPGWDEEYARMHKPPPQKKEKTKEKSHQ